MNVLALFDGHSGGQIALEVAGIPCAKYIASEIDKYARKVAETIYPKTISMGDVTKWREWNIDWASIDLLMGGSPCQGFSMAGKQAGTTAILNGEKVIVDSREKYLELKEQGAEFLSQSYLFWEYILCLDHVKKQNPDVLFFLENVKMKKEFLSLITNAIGVEPVFINSALVSAQNRQRYYWCNWEVSQPEDRGIVLADILESDGAGVIKSHGEFKPKNEKSQCIDANYHKGPDNHGQRTMIANPAAIVGRKLDENGKRNDSLPIKQTQCLEVHDHGKSRCLSTVQKDTVVSNLPAGWYPLDAELPPYKEWIKKTGEHGGSKREYQSLIIQKGRGNNPGGLRALDGKAPALTSNSYEHNNHVVSGIEIRTRGTEEIGIKGKSYAITASAGTGGKALVGTKENYRKLTPRECGRLQTIPEPILENILNSGVSNTQLYKMFGNGWTIEVIAHIFKQMPIKHTTPEKITVESLKMSNDLWSTPPEVFNALDMEFGFGFDVCAEHETAKCADYWTIEDDALSKDWAEDAKSRIPGAGLIEMGALWCNPPYSKITPWVEKAIEAQRNGRITVMLVMCDPSVKWFSLAAQFASEIRFVTEGRLAFLKNGKPVNHII